MKKRFLAVGAAVALVCGLAGCGSDKPQEDATPGAGFPVSVTTSQGEVTVAERPERIVSLSPTGTEMLFAIDAGKQVVAVDELSNYPQDAPKTELSGFTPNAEAIAGHQPDLVVLSFDANGVVAALKQLNIPVYVGLAAKNLDETYQQITQLGQLTGQVDQAAAVVQGMKNDITKLTADLGSRPTRPTYFYELDAELFTATSRTFIGGVFALAGLRNIADSADADGSGYPKLAAEQIIQANPDLIFLADTKCCAQSAETVAKRPGWESLAAVSGGRVVALDDDVASRWGPRTVDLVRIAVESAASVPVG